MAGIFGSTGTDVKRSGVIPVENPYSQVTTPEEVRLFRWLRSPEGGSRTSEEALAKTIDAFKEP